MNDELESPNPLSEIMGDVPLPPSVMQNLGKTVSTLGSSVISLVTGPIARREAEKWAEVRSRNLIRENVTNQIINDLSVPPEYAKAAVNRFASRLIKEQVNLDNIVRSAADQVRNATADCSRDNKEEISDDFLAHFEGEAKKQNTDTMQHLFARILAGEILQPGSYAIKSVRTVSEMRRDIAMCFQRLCSICISQEIQSDVLDVRALVFEGTAGNNALAAYGLDFGALVALEEYGLIISDFHSWKDYRTSIVDLRSAFLLPIKYQCRQWKLVRSTENKQSEFRIHGVALSMVGRELFSVVDQVENSTYTRNLNQFFEKKNMKMVQI